MIVLFTDGAYADYPEVKRCRLVEGELECSRHDGSVVVKFPALKVLAYGRGDEMEKVIRAVNKQLHTATAEQATESSVIRATA
jgi:hypothetical protein